MYRIRFIGMMLRLLFSNTQNLSEDFKLGFWAIPFIDTDLNRLFTQTYGLYMGLARWHLLFNSEFKNAALKKGWVPVTTSESITYYKSVKALDCITLTTRLLYWNERRFYLEHVFEVKGELRARALVEGLVRSPKGHLKPNEAFREMGVEKTSPPLTEEIRQWIGMLQVKKGQ